MSEREAYRILVVGPAWIGDMVMAQSLFIRLAEMHGSPHLDVLAPAWSAPLLDRMPQVRDTIEMPLGHGEFGFRVRRELGRSLRSRRYDQAIVLPRSFKSALVPYFARARIRTGYRGEMRYGLLNDMRRLDKELLPGTAQRYVALGEPHDAPLPPSTPTPRLRVDEDQGRRCANELGLTLDRPVVALLPGAEYGPAKQWPVPRFAALASRLENRYVWVFGSQKEKALGERIAAAGDHVTNLCGRTSLIDAVDLLALARVAVTNDSGLMHVAAAVGCHVAALFGSSSPLMTPPLTESRRIFYRGLSCSPCFQRTCRFGHYDCLVGIEVEQIAGHVAQVIDDTR